MSKVKDLIPRSASRSAIRALSPSSRKRIHQTCTDRNENGNGYESCQNAAQKILSICLGSRGGSAARTYAELGSGAAAQKNQLGPDRFVGVHVDSLDRQGSENLREERLGR